MSLVLMDGAELRGDIFIRPVSRFRSGPQDAADFLNEDDPYFALAPANAAPIIVAKENVARAESSLPQIDEAVEVPHTRLNVEVTLAGGMRCCGALHTDTPEDRARLIDYLNAFDQRFLAVYDSRKLTLVNRRAVAHVREVR